MSSAGHLTRKILSVPAGSSVSPSPTSSSINFSPGRSPTKRYWNLLFRHEAAEPDQVACNVEHLQLRAHVQNKRFAAMGEDRCAQHELNRLRNEHEISLNLRVRDGHRTAGADLINHPGNDAAIAAEDVAEPHRDEPRGSKSTHGLRDQLGYPLGRAHHVCRVGGLVSRNQDEELDTVPLRRLRDCSSSGDVVFDGFARVGLHQGNVLMRRRVKDDFGTMLREHRVHSARVCDVANNRADSAGRVPIC